MNNLLYLFLRILRHILSASTDVINKYLLEKKFCSVYEISLSNGIINCILFGIFSILNYYYFKLDDFDDFFNKFNSVELIMVLEFIIDQLGIYLCKLITNKNFAPCHIFIINIFGQFTIYKDDIAKSIIFIIYIIFILFLSLIFNELIEIKFWGLSDDTKRNITERAYRESKDLDNEITKNLTLDENEEIEENDNNEEQEIEGENKEKSNSD